MKKLLVVLLAVCMLFAFAACGSEPAVDDNPGAEGTDAGDNVLTMATNATFPPYEFYDGGQIVGIDAEIVGAVAEKLGMELEIVDMEFGSIIAAVQTGKVDLGAAGMTVTTDREKSVNFTTSYATGVQVVIVPVDSPITSIDDLMAEGAEYKIGVQQDTTGDIYATGDFGEDAIARYAKGPDAVMALTSGKVDCVITDNEPAKAYIADKPDLKILDSAYVTEDYSICVAKDNTELLDNINNALAELTADGTIDGIIAKYISAE